MPSPKSGKALAPVSPANPKSAEEADQADPGEIEKIKAEQRQAKAGKYGATPLKPHKPPNTSEEREKKNTWIEIELVDEDDKPVPGEKYRIVLPDETVAEGTLDENGFARIDAIEPGTCKIAFPDLDKSSWRRA